MSSDSCTVLPIDNPFLEWMGMELTAWSEGYAEMRMPNTPRLHNRTARVHGGVICTLADSVCGYSGLYAGPDEPALASVTLSLTTQFIASVPGDIIVAKGYVERKGRSVYFSRAEVWMDEKVLLATAVGTFKYVRQR